MSAPLGSIRNWSDVQLTEDMNDEDDISVVKYNEHWRRVETWKEEVEQRACKEVEHRQVEEQWRLEAERQRAKKQAKKCVSRFWFVMTELTVLGRGGCCTKVWKG